MLGFLFWIFMSSISHGNFGMHQSTEGTANIYDDVLAAAVPSPRAAHVRPNTGISAGSRDEGWKSSRQASESRTVQMMPGAPDPAKRCAEGRSHGYTKARKRAYKRALRRVRAQGSTIYRGQVFTEGALLQHYTPTPLQQMTRSTPNVARTPRRAGGQSFSLRCFSWNCGGLSTLKDELFTWLEEQPFQVVMLQESWLKSSLDYTTRGWICINSGLEQGGRSHAGVMTCLRSSTFSQQHVRYHHVLPGRVLHVQARFQGGWVNLINIYQRCWDFQTDQDRIVKERAIVWKAVRQTIGQVPQGHFLMIAGDLNTAISSHAPWLGKGMLKAAANSADAECLADLLSDTGLVAVNTFGRHNSYTYIHDGSQQARKSFVDYVLVRKVQAAKRTCSLIRNFQVGQWRRGGKHLPITVEIQLQPYRFTRPTATSEWPIWKCKLLQQQVKRDPDISLRFQQEVALALAESSDYHPHELNRKLLEIGRRVFAVHRPRSISPPWAQGAHVQTIKTMWLHYRHMKLARGVPGLRAVFQAMRHWTSFQRLHRQVQRHSRRLRRQHMDNLLTEAQARDQVDGSGAVFDLLKRVAPKQARKRTQLRDDSGRIMTPAEEAHALAAYWKDVCGSVHKTSMQEAPGGGDPFLTYDISPDDIKQALRNLHVGKAAPKHCAPHIMWKLAAEPIATFLEASVFGHWRATGAHIPDAWPGAWLTFLSKPNKAGTKPDHLRPIALLEPAGKAVSGIIKEHLTPYLEAWTRHLHFYGYLSNRSTHQALDLVFAHCELVRTRTQAQGRSPYAKRAGIGQYKCIGGLQVSVDCTQAFDRIDRGLLLQALTLLQVPLPLVDIIMRWVQDTTYHINQDDCEETFTSRRGVRQGCKLSPTLWCCIMVFIARSLDHSLGAQWCLEHLVGFADDLHLRWTFSTLAEMHTALQQAAQALAILEKMSLVLSKEKTVCLLKAEGSQAPHAKKKIIVQTKDGKYLQLSPDYRLPLKRQHPYLGAIISYADFENQNAKHRVQAGKVAFQRLRPYLMNRRALSFAKRVALWKATVVSSTFYGITASGITPKGLDLMRVTLTKQVRAMANSPRHLTLESDRDFWQRLRLKAPADLLLDRAQAIQHRTQELFHILEADDVRLSATTLAWENRVFTQLQTLCVGTDGGIISQHVCPSCHALFENMEALRAHIARKHSADRRQAEPTTFDHYRHGTDGMPQCSRCGHKFKRWADLAKHITGNHCQAVASTAQVPAQTVDSVAASPVPYLELARSMDATARDPRTMTLSKDLQDELLHHCAICRQWLPNFRYVKIHYTRVHPQQWQQHQAQTQQWRRQHIPKTVHECAWCGGRPSKGNVHSDTCPVLFQVTMVNAIIQAELQGPEAADAPSESTEPIPVAGSVKQWSLHCQFCSHACTKRGLRKHMKDCHSAWWHRAGSHVEALCSGWASGLAKPHCQFCDQPYQHRAQHSSSCHVIFQEAVHRSLTAHPLQHGDGERRDDAAIPGGAHGCVRGMPSSGGTESPEHAKANGSERKPRQLSAETPSHGHKGCGDGAHGTSEGGATSARATPPGQPNLRQFFGRPRASCGEHGISLSTPGRGATADESGQAVHDPLQQRPPGAATILVCRGPEVERSEREVPPGSAEFASRVPGEQHVAGVLHQTGKHGQESTGSGGTHQARLDSEERERTLLAVQEVEWPAAGAGHISRSDCPPGDVGEGGRAEGDLPRPDGAARAQVSEHPAIDSTDRGQHVAVSTFLIVPGTGGGSGPLDVQRSLREHGSPADRRQHAAGKSQEEPSGRRARQGPGPVAGDATGLRQSVLAVRLQNKSNTCYINSSILLWLWAYALTTDLADTAGFAATALRAVLSSKGMLDLLEFLPWRRFLQGWRNVRHQHDVQEWHVHLFSQAMPPSMWGSWQAKLLSLDLRDSANTYTPILMTPPAHLQECSLQTVVDQWSSQEAIHALAAPPRILSICLTRFGFNDAGAFKVEMPVSLQPFTVTIPCFVNEHSLETRSCQYTIIGAISHYGNDISSGHYRAMLHDVAESCWYITDDGARAKRAKTADMRHLSRNAYVIWLSARV